MIEKVMLWLLGKILEWLFGKAEQELKEVADKMALEKEREQVDEQNVIKYQEAKDRADRIKAASNLLNGNDAS
jgi:hypothetical protein